MCGAVVGKSKGKVHSLPVLGCVSRCAPVLSTMVIDLLSRMIVNPWSHNCGRPAKPTLRSSKTCASTSATLGIVMMPDVDDANEVPSGCFIRTG
jgi:hypothetical protein